MSAFRGWIFCILLTCLQCGDRQPSFKAPLLKGLGNYTVPVTTASDAAHRFFNQGIILANGFNHGEAERSFREAVRLDTSFAMGYWGIAYVLGPNLNSANNLGTNQDLQDALVRAERHSSQASAWEQALIRASRIAFPADSAAYNPEGFITALKEAYEKYQGNSFVATLYAESLMNAHAWDFYERKGGKPRPWTQEILTLLEKILVADPENPLAHHLYLHATEAGSDFTGALKSADRLKTLVPAAGHLVHMPSHIYINTGDYHAGSLSNEEAVQADSAYVAECQAQGYYPQLYYTHNYHFLAATTALEGRAARSIEAAFKAASLVDRQYYHKPGYETVQHYLTIPDHILVKFAQWEKILSLPEPDTGLAYPAAIRHYARGMAYSGLGRPAAAVQELQALRRLTQSPVIQRQMIWGINKAADVCRIASAVLEAEILQKKGDTAKAIPLLRDAIAVEDGLRYNEPPDWFFSVRHILGSLYLQSGDQVNAERTFREDLAQWPKNGFALNGLAESLAVQGKSKEAQGTRSQFTEAWKYADVRLKGAIIDSAQRKDLVLRVEPGATGELLAVSFGICR